MWSEYEWIYPLKKLKIIIKVWFKNIKFVNKRLTKRDELLLRVVLALPYASNTGLQDTIWSSKLGLLASSADFFLPPATLAATKAKYWMTFLVFSVLPAPDSPLNLFHNKCLTYYRLIFNFFFKYKLTWLT